VKNKLFIITGPSGSGKTSLMRKIMSSEIVSVTTREPRMGEVEGVDYYFINKDQFMDLCNKNQLVEHANNFGNYYGITKTEVDKKLAANHSFVIVTAHGKDQVVSYYPNCVKIFLYASMNDAYLNMLSRGDSPGKALDRLTSYEKEMETRCDYDYVIKNIRGQMDHTLRILDSIIQAEINKGEK